ncbi:MAG: hypothetical protein KA756_04195, partial [Steroidobacteraceae bacterium]|nr:hypothetical protein [Steroidobacteraceae bacterium]
MNDRLSVLLELVPTRTAQWPAGVDPAYEPVPLTRVVRGAAAPGGRPAETLVVRADIARAALRDLRAHRQVVGVWADP